MSSSDIIRIFFYGLFACILAFKVYRQDSVLPSDGDKPGRQFAPLISPTLLPIMIIIFPVVSLFYVTPANAARECFSAFFPIFLTLCIYYAILLLCQPLLHKYVSAKSAAVLWVMPNFLYIAVQPAFHPSSPLVVLQLPVGSRILLGALTVWLVGCIGVLSFSIFQHLRYRRFLKEHSVPVGNPEILKIWEAEQRAMDFRKTPLKLYTCAELGTPVSIGLFLKSTMVILPERSYTEEELRLIFRHELIHICHGDCQAKLFLRICTAMCWFNPLIWIAMRRCADDLELSCDEMVLSTTSSDQRQLYASLILSAAGDERGFTSCLSVGARALSYRLSRILHPASRVVGGVVVGIFFFLLLGCNGVVAVSYDPVPASSIMTPAVLDAPMDRLSLYHKGTIVPYECSDPQSLLRYIGSLEVSKLIGDYSFESDYELYIRFGEETGLGTLVLTDHTLHFYHLRDNSVSAAYCLAETPNWNDIRSLLTDMPNDDIWLPCDLTLNFGNTIPGLATVELSPEEFYTISADGQKTALELPQRSDHYAMENFPVYAVQLVFTYTPESYTVTVAGCNGETPYTLSGDDLYCDTVDFAEYRALYTISCIYAVEEESYVLTYLFEVIP